MFIQILIAFLFLKNIQKLSEAGMQHCGANKQEALAQKSNANRI